MDHVARALVRELRENWVVTTLTALVIVVASWASFSYTHTTATDLHTFQHSICSLVQTANAGVGIEKHRLLSAAARDVHEAQADKRIASVWEYAARQQPRGSKGHFLAERLIQGWHTLARLNRASAADLRHEVKAVRPISLTCR